MRLASSLIAASSIVGGGGGGGGRTGAFGLLNKAVMGLNYQASQEPRGLYVVVMVKGEPMSALVVPSYSEIVVTDTPVAMVKSSVFVSATSRI